MLNLITELISHPGDRHKQRGYEAHTKSSAVHAAKTLAHARALSEKKSAAVAAARSCGHKHGMVSGCWACEQAKADQQIRDRLGGGAWSHGLNGDESIGTDSMRGDRMCRSSEPSSPQSPLNNVWSSESLPVTRSSRMSMYLDSQHSISEELEVGEDWLSATGLQQYGPEFDTMCNRYALVCVQVYHD